MPGEPKMKINIITENDDKPKEYTDLVHNFTLFHEHFDNERLSNLPDWNDDTNYSKHPSLNELLSHKSHHGKIDPFNSEEFYFVRVPIDTYFSSEKSKGGGDRPLSQVTIKGIPTAKKNLDSPELDYEKGYNSEDADTFGGFFRIVEYSDTEVTVVLVKHKGNGRTNMKLMAHRGESTDVMMKVSFHNKDATLEEMIEYESERHTTDAGDRVSENEAAAFASGLKAKHKKAVNCYDFMKEKGFNYIKEDMNIMKLNNIEGHENFIPLKSLSGIKEGSGNGIFKTYGDDNVNFAVDSIKVCLEISNEQKEAESKNKSWLFNATVMDSWAYLYKIWTKIGPKGPVTDTTNPYFTVVEFDRFLKERFLYDYDAKRKSDYFGRNATPIRVNDFSKTSNVKNIPYLVHRKLLHWINEAYMSKNNLSQGIGVNSPAIKQIFKDIGNDDSLKKELRGILENKS